MTDPKQDGGTTTMTAAASCSLDAITRVSLESSFFTKALQDYIDENKPDPLVRRQMHGWNLGWHDVDDDGNEKRAASPTASWQEPPTHVLSGRLEWKGDYMSIPIDVLVYWKGEKEGSLFFSCTIPSDAVRFLPPPPTTAAAASEELKPKQQSEKDLRAANRVHQPMIERLQKDDYIQMITGKTSGKSNKPQQQKRHDLCEATIHFSSQNNHLEERVHCNEQTAEALRRAVYSTADSSLDIFDFVLYLPLLPTKAHAVAISESSLSSSCTTKSAPTTTTTTGLADRAKLRLLEDAMYDACEREEEEELVQDLHISKRAKKE